MSLVVPITTGQMMAGAQAYQPGAEPPAAVTAASMSPSLSVGASAGNDKIAFAVAGWIAFGLVGIILLDKWGFKVAHVP